MAPACFLACHRQRTSCRLARTPQGGAFRLFFLKIRFSKRSYFIDFVYYSLCFFFCFVFSKDIYVASFCSIYCPWRNIYHYFPHTQAHSPFCIRYVVVLFSFRFALSHRCRWGSSYRPPGGGFDYSQIRLKISIVFSAW